MDTNASTPKKNIFGTEGATSASPNHEANYNYNNYPLNPLWFANKESFYAACPKPPIVIARDVNEHGAKAFATLPMPSDFKHYIETLHAPNLYEVIPNASSCPCYIYMDIDKELGPLDDRNVDYDHILERFEHIFCAFMQQVYKAQVALVRGGNYQVCYTPVSPSRPKLSMHLKINIVCPNVETIKSLVINLDRYMSSNLYISTDDRQLFYYYKLKAKQQKFVSVIDNAVYTNFRGYRTLYSAKLNKSNALVPLPGFSNDPLDHLVVVYPDVPQTVIPVFVSNFSAEILADYSLPKKTNLSLEMLKLPDDHLSEVPALSAEIPSGLIAQLENTILASPDILRTFGQLAFKYNQFFNPTTYTFNIDKACCHHCPYADRTHTHNRSFFEYNYRYNTLRYKCFNDECNRVQNHHTLVYKISSTFDALKRLSDLNPVPTLHDKQNIIPWDENYDTPNMSHYPLKPLTVIRANMGTGKTHTLMFDFMTKNCMHPDTKCLFITYQILLSKKYHSVLQHAGFVNYHDSKGPIHDNKVIVCLDSLCRVHTQNFDYIFIDEVLSVLLHFNSSLMKQVSTVSTLFELLLLQAHHIYLLDAAADNAMVFNFVNYLAEKKNVVPYFIRNTHVKASNRRCNIHINRLREGGYPKALKLAAMQKVADALALGKKVVVSSSTKSFTKELMLFLESKQELHDKYFIVYNSDSDKSMLHDHATYLDKVWTTFDAVVYSPTIGAGLSFDAMHFDCMVGYMDNSFLAPTVDLILQQLFRVRNLRDGQMDLFVDDSLAVSPFSYPTSDEHVQDWLDENVRMMHAYFPSECVNYESPTMADANGIRYDKSRLSYFILTGIMANKNKSLLSYSKVICNTLQEDYHVPCNVVDFKTSTDVLTRAVALFQELKKTIKDQATIPFSEELLVDYETYIALSHKDNLTPQERLQKWIYDMAELWGVHTKRVDEHFFNECIGQVHDYDKMIKRFYRALRLKEALTRTVEENRETMLTKLENLAGDPLVKDSNLELYRSHVTKHYQQLIESQLLLNMVFGQDKVAALKTEPFVMEKGERIKANFVKYLETISEGRFRHIRTLFGLDPRNYQSLAKLVNEAKNQCHFINSLFRDAFGVAYYQTRRGRKKQIHYDEWGLDISKIRLIIDTYKVSNIRFDYQKTYFMIDADWDD